MCGLLAEAPPQTSPPFHPTEGDLIENTMMDWMLPWWWPTPMAPNYDDVYDDMQDC